MGTIPTSAKRPAIPAPGVMQVEALYSSLGQKCENVYHVLSGAGSGPPSTATMNAVAAAFINWEHVNGVTMRNNSTILESVVVRDLTTPTSPAFEYTPVVTVQGTHAEAASPGNVTIAIKWGTARRGRSYRGRTYHIGLCVALLIGNIMAPASVTDFTARYSALLTAFNGVAGCQMVVLSYAEDKFWRDTAVATPIVLPSIDPSLDSQRRRLIGRGD